MAYTLGNKCTNNLCKRIVLLQLIIENVVTCFLEHSVEWLPDGEKISKISLFVLAQLTNVTDGRTDGHRMPAIAALMHSIARQK